MQFEDSSLLDPRRSFGEKLVYLSFSEDDS
jgi:hypothetical protein